MSNKLGKRKAQDLLNTQNSGDENNGYNVPSSDTKGDNQNESYKHINYPIAETPFRLIGNERDGFIIVLGKHRMTLTPLNTPGETEKLLDIEPWNIIFRMIASMIEMNEELRKNTLDNTNEITLS